MIPYGRQYIGPEEIEAVVQTLESDFITQGPRVPDFESSLCDVTGARHAVAVNSATSALHIACLALGLKPGGILWTSPNSFVASANVGRLCGATVSFIDIDKETFNISTEALARKLEAAKAANALPDIVMPVHFGGESCDMERIAALAQEYNFKVIEDASHAIGGNYKGHPIGSCKYSDITVFSFHPVKIVTTAEGGAALTNDPSLNARMQLYRSHGVTRDCNLMEWGSDGPWYYQQIDLGLNYRMTELQAALGVVQMSRLDRFNKRRHEIADVYDNAFSSLELSPQKRQQYSHSGLHLYVVRLDDHFTKENRKTLFAHMRASEIGVNILYIPIHTQPYYKALGCKEQDCPEAVAYYERCLALPMYPNLQEGEQTHVINALKTGMERLVAKKA
jgi:UDP-4-amino-4,6-dideoxy-N-acetyl-beta-L-altrosamine transaminase